MLFPTAPTPFYYYTLPAPLTHTNISGNTSHSHAGAKRNSSCNGAGIVVSDDWSQSAARVASLAYANAVFTQPRPAARAAAEATAAATNAAVCAVKAQLAQSQQPQSQQSQFTADSVTAAATAAANSAVFTLAAVSSTTSLGQQQQGQQAAVAQSAAQPQMTVSDRLALASLTEAWAGLPDTATTIRTALDLSLSTSRLNTSADATSHVSATQQWRPDFRTEMLRAVAHPLSLIASAASHSNPNSNNSNPSKASAAGFGSVAATDISVIGDKLFAESSLPHLVALNPAQYMAATAPLVPLLTLASAGAGKTKTLVARVAHLLSTGVPPQSVLAITFTSKAAAELRGRISAVAVTSSTSSNSSNSSGAVNRSSRGFGVGGAAASADDGEGESEMGVVRRYLPEPDTYISELSTRIGLSDSQKQ